MTPPISVVMPVRDGARWLREAINSVQVQTLEDFELIIVDDGSEDDTPLIIEASARGDSRVRAIRQGRRGLVPALNRGLAEARGQLIARLDADDRAHPQRLERQKQYLDCHPEIGLLGTWADRIDEQGTRIGSLRPPTRPEALAQLLGRMNPILHSSVILRASVLQKVGFYRPAFEGAEDYDLWVRASEVTEVANLPECLLQYRVHGAGVSHRSRLRQMFSTRLVQRTAAARRSKMQGPHIDLTAPPDWLATESLSSPVYGDLARLYCLLDLADSQNPTGARDHRPDIAALTDCGIVLNHAERRMAQLALLNLLKRDSASRQASRAAVLLWHFIRLHPPRAIQLGYEALRKN
jgi:glycosyltransferase involved in cell wall biosynthesis